MVVECGCVLFLKTRCFSSSLHAHSILILRSLVMMVVVKRFRGGGREEQESLIARHSFDTCHSLLVNLYHTSLAGWMCMVWGTCDRGSWLDDSASLAMSEWTCQMRDEQNNYSLWHTHTPQRVLSHVDLSWLFSSTRLQGRHFALSLCHCHTQQLTSTRHHLNLTH